MRRRMKRAPAFLLATLALAACNAGALFATPTTTAPPPTATSTPEPLAASVNGQGILLSDFEDEVARFEAAQAVLGTDLASLGDYRTQVLEALIDRVLLAQGAVAEGKEVDAEAVESEVETLVEVRGGSEAMGAWMAENRYTLDSFKQALRQDMLSAMMVEAIDRDVGETAEQVRAAHILVASHEEADGLSAELAAGADFGDLARASSLDPSSRPAGGDLGWFPAGYLLVPEVGGAAWELAPGETSDVIESALGYHIVRVLERGEHTLSPDARRFLRERAVREWLQARRDVAAIETYAVP